MTEYETIKDLTDIQAGDHVTITHGPAERRAETTGVVYRDEFGVRRVGTVGLTWGDVKVVSIHRPINKVYWPGEPGLYTIADRDGGLHAYRLFRLDEDGTWEELSGPEAGYIRDTDWKDLVDSGEWTLRRLRIAD